MRLGRAGCDVVLALGATAGGWSASAKGARKREDAMAKGGEDER